MATFRQISTLSGGLPTPILYSDLQNLVSGNVALPGFYLITDATPNGKIPLLGAKADLGVLVYVSVDNLGHNVVNKDAVGTFLNPDYDLQGNYSGVEALTGLTVGSNVGIWNLNVIEFTYTNNGGIMNPGEDITNVNTGGVSTVVFNDGNKIKVLSTVLSDWLNGNTCNNLDGDEITLTSDGSLSAFYNTGDIVIWNGRHFQVSDSNLVDAQEPSGFGGGYAAAYTPLFPKEENLGYIKESDVVEYDFETNLLVWRKDKRGNVIPSESMIYFQFGSGNCVGNEVSYFSSIYNINQRGSFNGNILNSAATLSSDNTHRGAITFSKFGGMSNAIGGNYSVNMEPFKLFRGNVLDTDQTVMIEGSVDHEAKALIKGTSSTFETTFNIDGVTTIDFVHDTFLSINDQLYNKSYVGIMHLTSPNGTETINTLEDFPDHPVKIIPSNTLVLSISSGGNIVNPGIGLTTINGTTNDWVEFTKINGLIYITALYQG